MDPRELNLLKIYEHSNFSQDQISDRIAVIFYGHLRSFLYCIPTSLAWISKFNDIDIYIHTWDEFDPDATEPSCNSIIVDLIYAVLKGYNISGLVIESQPKDKNHPRWYYMYYSLWASNNLKKKVENTLLSRYKRCIKIRPDSLLSSSYESKSNLFFDNNKEYFLCRDDKSCCDIIASTYSQTMDTICSYLAKIDTNRSQETIGLCHYEYLTKKLHLIPFDFKYGQDWKVIRANYRDL